MQGEDGYHFGTDHVHLETRHPTHTQGKAVSCMAYYAYHFMVQPEYFNLLLCFRDLSHQFAVDMYVKIESERLLYSRTNQTQLAPAIQSGRRLELSFMTKLDKTTRHRSQGLSPKAHQINGFDHDWIYLWSCYMLYVYNWMAGERTTTHSHSHLALRKNHLKSNVSVHYLIYKNIHNLLHLVIIFFLAETPSSLQSYRPNPRQIVHGP